MINRQWRLSSHPGGVPDLDTWSLHEAAMPAPGRRCSDAKMRHDGIDDETPCACEGVIGLVAGTIGRPP